MASQLKTSMTTSLPRETVLVVRKIGELLMAVVTKAGGAR